VLVVVRSVELTVLPVMRKASPTRESASRAQRTNRRHPPVVGNRIRKLQRTVRMMEMNRRQVQLLRGDSTRIDTAHVPPSVAHCGTNLSTAPPVVDVCKLGILETEQILLQEIRYVTAVRSLSSLEARPVSLVEDDRRADPK
jgi:hypothetical protein